VTELLLVGSDDVATFRIDLMSYETARSALTAYDLREPYENTVAIETISLGQAVSLLGDLNWYLVRLTDIALVREPSVSKTEWLSRDAARAVRDGELQPGETSALLKIYGIDDGELVEPMYVTRRDGEIPDYDLRDVDDTLVVRVTEDEFG
jgi:hypothetical protein